MLKIIILSFCLTSLQTAHDSFLGIECIPVKGIIRTSLKMNYNDFIFDYRININDDQIFDPSGKIDTTEILLSKYLLSKIQISADDKSLKGKLMNIEFENGNLKFELVYDFDKRARQVKVKNTILTDVNRNQTNLLIFKYDHHEEGVKLSPEKTEHTFKIKKL